uniref:General transcription and DNA repair factor IIH helicase subunit XPD n=1 Tax=Dermatophagoides pteronyssinus TaxID=6956 RepID=A0A6P6XXG4_DERPT|nr:general transcription and DNA repair factor IIH helicase subunit XPD-like [Dermatophagoides pteronyssinus]
MMRFHIEEIEVFFPHDAVYPEQYAYMRHLKRTLDAKGNAVLEMPTGTGKTVCLMALYSAYMLVYPETLEKFYFCTRTVGEMNKALLELRLVLRCRMQCLLQDFMDALQAGRPLDRLVARVNAANIMACGLSARRNLCVNPSVNKSAGRGQVDEQCRSLIVPWNRRNPYYGSRELAKSAQIVVLNYQYVLDPRVSQIPFGQSSVYAQANSEVAVANIAKQPWALVFDEAHNIDNVCIEALSVDIYSTNLEEARLSLEQLKKLVRERETAELERVKLSLVEGVHAAQQRDYAQLVDEFMSSPLLPEEQAKLGALLPGSIRKNRIFLNNLLLVVVFLDSYVKRLEVSIEGPLSFLRNLEDVLKFDASALKLFYDRLKTLFLNLQVTRLQEFASLSKVADFCTLLANYWKGFVVIADPYPDAPGIYDPVIRLACLDSSICMRSVTKRFSSIVLTSGTISPLHLYSRILDFSPIIMQSFQMSLDRECICPLIVGKGDNGVHLSSRFELREDASVIQQYGELVARLCQVVPDGVVLFFTSYAYMAVVLLQWYNTGYTKEIMKYKLIFMETKDSAASSVALENYRRCCDIGRGAVFMSIARGKVAEGIDFDRHYGRAVVLIGVPYQYTLSHVLKARLLFLKKHFQLEEGEFLSFDAMRQASQCLGRVIRNKADYGLMVLADYRYAKPDKLNKFPEWVVSAITSSRKNIALNM